MATDPVCNMKVEPDQAAAKAEYRGISYYFCSSGCHAAFTAAPEKYAQKTGSEKPDAGGTPRSSRR